MKKIQPYPYLPDLEGGQIADYLQALNSRSSKGLRRGPVAELVRRVLPPSLRDWAKVNATTALTPFQRRRARQVATAGRPIRLNLGSGPVRIPGWHGIDIVGMNADLVWDLRRGVPFADDSVDAVFLEHVIEHFTLSDTLALLEECRRVLVPGGVVRLGVPDFGRYMQSYADDRGFIESLRPRRPTPLLAVAEVAFHHGHRSIWDAETLERALTEVGFVEVRRREFGDSELAPPPDTPDREPETVYAEGRKRSD